MNFISRPKEYWEGVANNKRRLIVFYGADVIDLTGFAPDHPGGLKAITVYRLKDIKNIIFRVYPHPNSIIKTISQFKCGHLEGYQEVQALSPSNIRKGICSSSKAKQKKQKCQKNVCFASQEKNKKTKKTKGGQTLSISKFKKNNFDESQIDFDDDKPQLRVPLLQIRLGCIRQKGSPKKNGKEQTQ